MSDDFQVEVTESAVTDNPAVAAELRGGGGSGRLLTFKTLGAAIDWCERMNRIGTKTIQLEPTSGDAAADARAVDEDTALGSEMESDIDEEGGFDDFLDDAF